MTAIPGVRLNDGHEIPTIGFGTYPLKGDDGVAAIRSALDAGYRLIDTAVNYENEEEVGEALRSSGLPRDEVQITTKVPGRDHGYDETIASLTGSLERLGVDHVDLYLIHWPNPSVDRFVDTWRAMIELRSRGLARSIGVSNFTREYLTRLADETGVVPAVNQIELHPYFPQADLLSFHEANGIATEAWSPLGKAAKPHENEVVTTIAEKYGVMPGQIVLRWHLERGVIAIPKSATPSRQKENFDVFGFELSADDVDAITALGRPDGRLFGGDPTTHEEM
ncbi:aldo/keto reductase [Labedella populi]|uniref:Aldo/keto reductase n=1 Tax=Labedella populi TaxID=2498850 RepID=A0A444Q2A7_9MICO|nr:aldo/keto reductase [Labedella populi]RWZ55363.1 aldo/keto reductase [Labedella populi]